MKKEYLQNVILKDGWHKPKFAENQTGIEAIKSQIIFLLYTLRNYGRYFLIIVNIITIILKLIIG